MQPHRDPLRRSPLGALLESGAAGGILLMAAASLALLIANSLLAPAYFGLLKRYVGPLNLLHWINDALMAVFFLLVGLEIKREFIDGQLSSWSRRILPGVSALGGMIVPALIYLALTRGDPIAMRGWAIPAATDIAFALGVLALLGPKVPVSLKVFLTALAILDDLGAVILIAIFYTGDLSLPMLAASAACIAALAALNAGGVQRLTPYLVLGALLWFFVLRSGVHATLAGVALALTIPFVGRGSESDRPEDSPLHRLEHALSPYVTYLVVPIFGFANAGVSLAGMSVGDALAPVPLGVAAGLFLGKQLGVFGLAWLAVRTGLAHMPAKASMLHLYGVALLCGIGFTMSLFIGALAFPENPELGDATKIGVLAGSVLSALAGALVLRLASGRKGA